jgi:hypothetical protein
MGKSMPTEPISRTSRPHTVAKLGHTFLAAQLFQKDTEFCLIFAPLKATMSQKFPLLQPTQSVSRVLMADKRSN